VPLKVDFTDRSTGTISSTKWNFGDGTTSTVKNPSHKFTKAGKFKVVLTVSNKDGSSSKSQYVTVSK
jgi:PKD repeat protein